MWNLINISHFSSTACTAAMAKRAQQESGEERVTAKSRLVMNLTARMPSAVSSSASTIPGRPSYGYQDPGKSVGELSNTCSQIVLKCLYLARIGRPDILWSVNKLARSITKWTKACDKRLNRLFHILIIRVNTNSIVLWEILLNNAHWDCFRNLTSREILKIQNPLR